MGNLAVFNNEQFGKVRVIERDGEPWFVGKDVAEALGYAKPLNALASHVDEDDSLKQGLIDSMGRTQEAIFINESGVYSLVFASKLPTAKAFKRWVTSEILPIIRQTGGYVQENREAEFIKNYFPSFSDETKLTMVLDLREQNQNLRKTIAEQKPKVAFADQVADSKGLLTISGFAKIVQDEHINMGRNKLFEWLRNEGYLRSNNEPYQRYVNQGLFKVRETLCNGFVRSQTFVTGKGQLYLVDKLKKAV